VVVTACASAAVLPPSAPSPLAGQPLPAVRAASLDGRPVNLPGGRPVVVKFFADYCEPCKRTLPFTERVALQNEHVLFVGVSEDDYASTAQQVAERYGLTFPVVHDASKAFLGRFRVHELPMTFVADSTGTVRWVGAAGQTESDLEAAVRAVH
jgi:thiol-disulfide isomerase/thioredoxin